MKFNDALLKINLAVLTEYPSAQFYEAQGFLVPTDNIGCKVDGTIDTAHFKVAYNYFDDNKQKTIIGTFNDDLTVNIKVIDDIWIEDIITTPYVPTSCEQAIEVICKKLGSEAVGEGPVTLRHQLYPGEAEPRYFFGSLGNIHTVNVYTRKVDAPIGHSVIKNIGKKIGLGIYKLFA
jgi:hypothetical protein